MSENPTLERLTTDDAVSLSEEQRNMAVVLDKKPVQPGTGRPLRVMQIMTRLAVGGAASHAIFLTERLQAPDFQSILLIGRTEQNEGNVEYIAQERGLELIRIPGLGREVSPKSDLLTLVHLYQQMRRFRPDIVHTHLSKAGAVGRLAARLARVPIVIHTYHNNIFQGYFSKRRAALFLRIERALARCTDAIIVLGEGQERELLAHGIGRPGQLRRIPLGLELDPFLRTEACRGELRRQLRVPDDIPLIGIVARLVPIKAHNLFLDAARRVAMLRPDAHFVLIGDGELRNPLEQQALDMGFRVQTHQPDQPPLNRVPLKVSSQNAGTGAACSTAHFLGFRSDLPTIYADLNVLVLCSISEGLPVSIIEAMASGCPVVSTEVGAIRDLVIPGETGLLVPAGDVEGLSRGILEIIDNPARSAVMVQHGRAHVSPHFSIERMERELRRLYADLAQAKNLL
jgi:glycosyltransferase involved in cell wall biosynthesis